MPLRREPPALVVRQPKALPLQLLSKNVVLFYEVLEEVLLVAVNPSGEGHEQQP
jgi:hypothetical protein